MGLKKKEIKHVSKKKLLSRFDNYSFELFVHQKNKITQIILLLPMCLNKKQYHP